MTKLVFICFLFLYCNNINSQEIEVPKEQPPVDELCVDFCFTKKEYNINKWEEFIPVFYVEYCEHDNTYIELPTEPKLGYENDLDIDMYFIFQNKGQEIDYSTVDYQYLPVPEDKIKLFSGDRNEYKIYFSSFYQPESVLGKGDYTVQAFLRLKTISGQTFKIISTNEIRIKLN